MTSADTLDSLEGLCGLRTAPSLDPEQRRRLRSALEERLAGCEWFTVGVMATTGTEAIAALRQLEGSLGWEPLEGEEVAGGDESLTEGVFLKGNQTTGRFRIRPEAGLGLGVLITGHSALDPGAEGTWGPFPLDFFA